MYSWLEYFALAVIATVVFKFLLNIGHFLYTTYLGAALGLNIDLRKCGSWAVVTGATDGIGKAYAKELVALGLNVVLVSRSQEKLEMVAKELKEMNSMVKFRIIVVDFTHNASIYAKIAPGLEGLDIGVLVNNVGMNYFNQWFDKMDVNEIDNLTTCNMTPVVRITRTILPKMIERGRGVIINVSSYSGAVYTPMMTLYGATKAFVEKFSQNLSYEVESKGVTVQTVMPSYVLTKMVTDTMSFHRATWIVPNARDYVRANLRCIGLERRTAAFWSHRIQLWIGDFGKYFYPDIATNIAKTILVRFALNDPERC